MKGIRMDIKAKAAVRTAIMFLLASVAPFLVMVLFKLDNDTLLGIFFGGFLVWMIWVVYSINLRQLESEEEISKMQERHSTSISSVVKNPQ